MKKTETVSTKENIGFKKVNDDADDVAGVLGISAERRDEICEVLEKQWETEGTHDIAEDLSSISTHMTSHQELSFASFVYGCHVGQQKANPLASLAAAMMQMAGDEDDNY